MTGLHYFTDVDVVNKLFCGDVVVVNIHYHPTKSGATVFQIMVDSNKQAGVYFLSSDSRSIDKAIKGNA